MWPVLKELNMLQQIFRKDNKSRMGTLVRKDTLPNRGFVFLCMLFVSKNV